MIDSMFWTISTNDNFLTASCYNALNTPITKIDTNLNWLWKIQLKKIILFLWLCWHDRIKSNHLLHHRGMLLSENCYNSRSSIEDTKHILRSCNIARSVWNTITNLLPSSCSVQLMNRSSLQAWLQNSLSNHTTILLNIP